MHTLAGRLRRERRADQRHQYLDRAARRSEPARFRRRRSPSPTPIRCSAGTSAPTCRTSGSSPTQLDPQSRPSLRSTVSVRRCQPVQPARRAGVQAVGRHHLPRRLCPLFHAADAGAGDPVEPRLVQQHDEPAGSPLQRSGAARSAPIISMSASTRRCCPASTVGVDTYYKIAKDMIDDGQFGQAVVLTQFNWARGYSEGAEVQGQIPERQLQRLCQLRLQHHAGDRPGIEPVSPRPATNMPISSPIITTPTTCSC